MRKRVHHMTLNDSKQPENKDSVSDFEAILKAALSVPLPKQLATRLQMQPPKPVRVWPLKRWAAWAAVILLSIGTLLWRPWQGGIEAQVFAHIYEELGYLSADHQVPMAQVRAVFQTVGLKVREDFPTVRFIGPCVIQGHPTVHMIFAGQAGAVTVIYLPGRHTGGFRAGQDSRFIAQGVSALGGTLVIVGERGEDLKGVEQLVLARVKLASRPA